MNKIDYNEIVSTEKMRDAFINHEFIGFVEDYSIIHCLLKEWKPNTIFEIGTNVGNGCMVIRAACPTSRIITLDIREEAGNLCPSDVIKVTGNSLSYDYNKHYPIDCWFIDGEHTYHNVYTETSKALMSSPKYIIYHDVDIEEIYRGIEDSFKDNNMTHEYEIYHVINPPFVYSSSGKNVTRVAYAIKNNNL
jgi:predicted O-methyltransferase YrrM